jgi:hypothetical protein
LDSFANALTLHAQVSIHVHCFTVVISKGFLVAAVKMMSSQNDDDPFLQVQA